MVLPSGAPDLRGRLHAGGLPPVLRRPAPPQGLPAVGADPARLRGLAPRPELRPGIPGGAAGSRPQPGGSSGFSRGRGRVRKFPGRGRGDTAMKKSSGYRPYVYRRADELGIPVADATARQKVIVTTSDVVSAKKASSKHCALARSERPRSRQPDARRSRRPSPGSRHRIRRRQTRLSSARLRPGCRRSRTSTAGTSATARCPASGAAGRRSCCPDKRRPSTSTARSTCAISVSR